MPGWLHCMTIGMALISVLDQVKGHLYIPLVSRVAGQIRLRRCESVVDGYGLTFIALQNDHAKALKINPHRQLRFNERLQADWAATRMGRVLLHVWLCWTRLPYPDTVFADPPCQTCNSPTARPRQVYRGALKVMSCD